MFVSRARLPRLAVSTVKMQMALHSGSWELIRSSRLIGADET